MKIGSDRPETKTPFTYKLQTHTNKNTKTTKAGAFSSILISLRHQVPNGVYELIGHKNGSLHKSDTLLSFIFSG